MCMHSYTLHTGQHFKFALSLCTELLAESFIYSETDSASSMELFLQVKHTYSIQLKCRVKYHTSLRYTTKSRWTNVTQRLHSIIYYVYCFRWESYDGKVMTVMLFSEALYGSIYPLTLARLLSVKLAHTLPMK